MPEQIIQNHPEVAASRRAIRRNWKPGKYALCGDFHAQYHHPVALDQLIATKGSFDGCIVAGDLLDCHDASRFLKDTTVTMEREIKIANTILDRLTKRFGRVLFFKGNHEERLWKKICFDAEAMVKAGGKLGSDIAPQVYREAHKLLARQNDQLNATVHEGWWVEIGSCLLCHADKYSGPLLKTAEGVAKHLLGRMKDYGIKKHPSLVTQSHTHRQAGPGRWLDSWLWELPAMTGMIDYQTSSGAHIGHSDVGFVVLTMHKDGSFWYNESKTVMLEEK